MSIDNNKKIIILILTNLLNNILKFQFCRLTQDKCTNSPCVVFSTYKFCKKMGLQIY